jgi:hypothetical protein
LYAKYIGNQEDSSGRVDQVSRPQSQTPQVGTSKEASTASSDSSHDFDFTTPNREFEVTAYIVKLRMAEFKERFEKTDRRDRTPFWNEITARVNSKFNLTLGAREVQRKFSSVKTRFMNRSVSTYRYEELLKYFSELKDDQIPSFKARSSSSNEMRLGKGNREETHSNTGQAPEAHKKELNEFIDTVRRASKTFIELVSF